MIRTTPHGNKYWFGVPSNNRPLQAQELERIAGPATWYVRPSQVNRYAHAGVEWFAPRAEDETLVETRNRILEDAFSRDLPAVMSDDDLRGLEHVIASHPHETQPILFDDMIDLMLYRNRKYFPKLSLNSQRTDAQPLGFKYATRSHLKMFTSFLLIQPNGLRFDTRFYHSEDYDYYLQHMRRHGGVIVHHDILGRYDHGKMYGGFTDQRLTADIEEKVKRIYELFNEKWGEYVVCGKAYTKGDNPYLIQPKYSLIKRDFLNKDLTGIDWFVDIPEHLRTVLIGSVYRYQECFNRHASIADMLLDLIEIEETKNA